MANEYIKKYNREHFKTITIQFNPSVVEQDKIIYDFIKQQPNMNVYLKNLVLKDMKGE